MKNKNILLIIIAIIVVGFIWYALGAKTSKIMVKDPNKTGKLNVAASFYPLYFFAREIGGDMVEVKNITPAGAEPHDYDPTTQDIANIEKGNMLVLNGGVEAWGDKIKDNLKGTSVKIVIAGDSIITKELTEGGEKMKDPHVWLAPKLAKIEAAKIAEGFEAIDTQNSNYYKDNEKKLNNKLDALDAAYKKGLQNCQSKDIITSHAAFAYLAQAYALNQIAISGLSPDEEPSAQQLASVAEFAKEHNAKYIFFESLVSPKLSETVANEIGAQTLVLDPIEGISDRNIRAGQNYFTVMEDNLKNLRTALQCN